MQRMFCNSAFHLNKCSSVCREIMMTFTSITIPRVFFTLYHIHWYRLSGMAWMRNYKPPNVKWNVIINFNVLLFIIISLILKQLANLCSFSGSEISPNLHRSQEDQHCTRCPKYSKICLFFEKFPFFSCE